MKHKLQSLTIPDTDAVSTASRTRCVGLLALLCVFALHPKTSFAQEPVSALLTATSAVKLVAEYVGFVESLSSKVDRLLDADLKTAVSLLEQAKASPAKAGYLVKDARIYFTRAASVEADSLDEARRHKRAVALLGLWACCEAVDDTANAVIALKTIDSISEAPSRVLVVKYSNTPVKLVIGELFQVHGLLQLVHPPTTKDYRSFDRDFDSLLSIKESVKAKLTQK